MLTWLPKLILLQFACVFLLALYTLILLAFRKHFEAKRKIIHAHYHNLLATELIDLHALPSNFDRWKQMKLDRKLFHEVIVEQIKMMSGEERAFLLYLYAALNYKKHAVQACTSYFWNHRLNALIQLGLLGSEDLAPLFHKMIRDPVPLVSIAATLSLSKLKHPLNGPELLQHLPASLLSRSNALYEVIANIGILHGVPTLVDGIRRHREAKVVAACIRALRHIRSLEATEALSSLLRHPTGLSSVSVREIIETLTQIGDPSTLGAVRPYLEHPVPAIRAESALFLLMFQDESALAKMESMKNDPHVEVRRAIQIYHSLTGVAS